MLKRQLIFFAVAALPAVAFAIAFRHALYLVALVPAPVIAWWSASPVSWPTWLVRGLIRAFSAAALIALLLFATS